MLLWLAGNIKREGRQIKQSMQNTCCPELEPTWRIWRGDGKAVSYTLGRNEITVADIDAICTTQITNKIFDMIEAVATRQQRKALDYYYDLLRLKEPPMRILYLLARTIPSAFAGERSDEPGSRQKHHRKKSGTSSFVAGKYMQQSRSFTMRELKVSWKKRSIQKKL